MLETSSEDELLKVIVAVGIMGMLSALFIVSIPELKYIEPFVNANKILIGNLLGVLGYSALLVIWRKEIAKLTLFIKKEIEKIIIIIAF